MRRRLSSQKVLFRQQKFQEKYFLINSSPTSSKNMDFIGVKIYIFFFIFSDFSSFFHRLDPDGDPGPQPVSWVEGYFPLQSHAPPSSGGVGGLRTSWMGRRSMYPSPSKHRHRFRTFPGGPGRFNCQQTKKHFFCTLIRKSRDILNEFSGCTLQAFESLQCHAT